jgi:hypothetical protein
MSYDFTMMRFVYVSFMLNVSVCLCAGDATAHNVYRYEWLHIMFYDTFRWIFMLGVSVCI